MLVILVLVVAVLLIFVIWSKSQPPTQAPLDLRLESLPRGDSPLIASSESQYTSAGHSEDDCPLLPISQVELTAFVLGCLHDHNAMSCYIGGEECSLLPLSLTGDLLTAMPLDFAYDGEARRKTFKLISIREPHKLKLQPRERDLVLVRLGLKHAIPLSICYFDKSGKEAKDEELTPIREEGEFLFCQSEEADPITKIRIQWIGDVEGPFGKLDVSEAQLRGFASDLIASGESQLRLEGLFLSDSLGTDDHLATLMRLAGDSDIRVREAVADATRQHTERIRKTVMRKTYTFVNPNQNPRSFELLETLAQETRRLSERRRHTPWETIPARRRRRSWNVCFSIQRRKSGERRITQRDDSWNRRGSPPHTKRRYERRRRKSRGLDPEGVQKRRRLRLPEGRDERGKTHKHRALPRAAARSAAP